MRKKGQKNKEINFTKNYVSCDLNFLEVKRIGLTPSDIENNAKYYRNLKLKDILAKSPTIHQPNKKYFYGPFLVIRGQNGERAYLRALNLQDNFPKNLTVEFPPSIGAQDRTKWQQLASKVFKPNDFISDYEKVPIDTQTKKPWNDFEESGWLKWTEARHEMKSFFAKLLH